MFFEVSPFSNSHKPVLLKSFWPSLSSFRISGWHHFLCRSVTRNFTTCHQFSLQCSGLVRGCHLTIKTRGWAASLQWAAGAPGLPMVLPCHSLYYFVCSFYKVGTDLWNYSLSSLHVQYMDCRVYLIYCPSRPQKCRENLYWIFENKSGPLNSRFICLLLCTIQGWFCWSLL